MSEKSLSHSLDSIRLATHSSMGSIDPPASFTDNHDDSAGSNHAHPFFPYHMDKSIADVWIFSFNFLHRTAFPRKTFAIWHKTQIFCPMMRQTITVLIKVRSMGKRMFNILVRYEEEFKEIYESLKKCVMLRQKYMAVSLQRPGDNPKDHAAYKAYPVPDSINGNTTRVSSELNLLSSTLNHMIDPLSIDMSKIPTEHEYSFRLDEDGVFRVYAEALTEDAPDVSASLFHVPKVRILFCKPFPVSCFRYLFRPTTRISPPFIFILIYWILSAVSNQTLHIHSFV